MSAANSSHATAFWVRNTIALKLILRFALIGVAVGVVYGHLTAPAQGTASIFDGVARGAIDGAMISIMISSFEVLFLQAEAGAAVRRLPFLPHLAIKTLCYLVIFLFALSIGAILLPSPQERVTGFVIYRQDVVFCFIVSFVIVFLFDISQLLGPNVMLNLLTGRYHRPKVEDRVFLLIDMEDSTRAAERLGEVAFHRLLNRFVSDLTFPILRQRGEIYRFVGDELIASWKLDRGVEDAHCVRACFEALATLATLGPLYERDYGVRPSFRAGLHCGPVVVGEMGVIKKEIAFLGDTMNTAERIQAACRETGYRVLASVALVDRLQLPPGIVVRSLGAFRLRGKESDIALCALEETAMDERENSHERSIESGNQP